MSKPRHRIQSQALVITHKQTASKQSRSQRPYNSINHSTCISCRSQVPLTHPTTVPLLSRSKTDNRATAVPGDSFSYIDAQKTLAQFPKCSSTTILNYPRGREDYRFARCEPHDLTEQICCMTVALAVVNCDRYMLTQGIVPIWAGEAMNDAD